MALQKEHAMTYRDILVQIDETPTSRGRARFAAGLAGRFEAHLTGVFLKSQFLHQYMAAESLSGMSPDMIDSLLTEHLKAVDKAGEEARMVFEAAAAETGASSEWLTIEGDAPTDLVDCARRSDLTVFPVSATASMGQTRHSAASLALANGGPVLVAPADPPAGSVGRNILIGWNGSREAARALHDAWPFIREADEVHVLIVSTAAWAGLRACSSATWNATASPPTLSATPATTRRPPMSCAIRSRPSARTWWSWGCSAARDSPS
jgi:nucleotide-binding universal stress UspA family protein